MFPLLCFHCASFYFSEMKLSAATNNFKAETQETNGVFSNIFH